MYTHVRCTAAVDRRQSTKLLVGENGCWWEAVRINCRRRREDIIVGGYQGTKGGEEKTLGFTLALAKT